MALVEVKVPDIGDFDEVAVIELLVKPGDTVAAEQSLLTVESDKASMEIPSSHAGVLKSLKVALGDKVHEGSLIAVLEVAEVAHAAATAAAPPTPQPAAAPPTAPAPAASAVPAASASTVGPIDVLVPDIGDFDEVAVIEVFVKPGDSIKVEQSLITVESDKASMEIPSSHAGVVQEMKVKVGDKVARGSLIAVVQGAAAAAPAATAPAAIEPAPAPAAHAAATAPAPTSSAPVPAHEPTADQGKLPHASPTIRRLARELGVPLVEVTGSGPKGRITQDDLQGFVKQVMSGALQTVAQKTKAPAVAGGALPGLLPWPVVDFAKFGPVERRDLGRIKKISAANLHRNWVVIPHVTNHDDADITELEAFRVQLNKENEKSGVKVTMLAFLIKACVAALKKFPEFNASLDGEQLVLKNYFHIGFAADTPNGLMVPVIKDADQKGVLQISQEMGELAKKAREGKISPADMSGGCFSISSLGGIGGRYFTPIINAPEVSILGVCKSAIEPKWDGKGFHPRLMLPLSLSWDHRVIDGASAARFNAYLGSILADFRRVLL
ncbi:MAG: dihydrolipoyllysine-residue acetyltransferase [Rubrivivax sp.]|nr:dihydrolipoyllysine-residue acetyltransferase [Rubrivivax sp.]